MRNGEVEVDGFDVRKGWLGEWVGWGEGKDGDDWNVCCFDGLVEGKLVDCERWEEVGVVEEKGVMGRGLVVIDVEEKLVVVWNGKFGEREEGVVGFVGREREEIVVGRERKKEVVVNGGWVGEVVVEEVEGDIVEVKGEVGVVVDLCVEIEEVGV